MMTRREADQRASVYNCYIRVSRTDKILFAACHNNWSHRYFNKKVVWREDIEDAVLDCGKIKGQTA